MFCLALCAFCRVACCLLPVFAACCAVRSALCCEIIGVMAFLFVVLLSLTSLLVPRAGAAVLLVCSSVEIRM